MGKIIIKIGDPRLEAASLPLLGQHYLELAQNARGQAMVAKTQRQTRYYEGQETAYRAVAANLMSAEIE